MIINLFFSMVTTQSSSESIKQQWCNVICIDLISAYNIENKEKKTFHGIVLLFTHRDIGARDV